MAQQATLVEIADHWRQILSHDFVKQTGEEYATLKGDGYDRDHDSPSDHVLNDLQSLSKAQLGSLSFENAQTLYFLQQFIKTQVKALEKASLPWAKRVDEKQLLNDLKTRLADVENILSPEEMERLSREARNQQRQDGGEWKKLHGYKNWLDGTLTEEQSAVLSSMQWQTASGPVQPVKTIVDFVDHFAEEHLNNTQNRILTAVITKLVVDSIVFMTSVTGAHQTVKDAAEEADKIAAAVRDQDSGANSVFAELEQWDVGNLSINQGFDAADETLLDARCLDKVDTGTNLVGMAVENFIPDQCYEISQGLQTWFAVSTATPKTLMAAQKASSEAILKPGTFAAESYNRHHENASTMIEWLAFYDNALHAVLLGVGAIVGSSMVRKHGLKGAPVEMWKSLKQQLALAQKRPLTFGGVLAGGAAYASMNGGQVLDTDILPFLVVGAMAGYLTQRKAVHLKENKNFLFNLHANMPREQKISAPLTSFDQKSNWGLKVAASALAISATTVLVNNVGIVDQAPELVRTLVDFEMAAWAYTAGGLSWAVFDRLDDFVYHKTFFGTGVANGVALTSATVMASDLLFRIPGVKKAWDYAAEAGKKTTAVLVLSTGLNITEPDDDIRYRDRLSPPEILETGLRLTLNNTHHAPLFEC
jgi:hypothetical protein